MSQTNGQPTNADILREIRNVYGEIRSLKEGQLGSKPTSKRSMPDSRTPKPKRNEPSTSWTIHFPNSAAPSTSSPTNNRPTKPPNKKRKPNPNFFLESAQNPPHNLFLYFMTILKINGETMDPPPPHHLGLEENRRAHTTSPAHPKKQKETA